MSDLLSTIIFMSLLAGIGYLIHSSRWDSRKRRNKKGERRLSNIEKWCRSRRDFIGVFNLTVHATIDDLLDEQRLRESLLKLQQRFNILRSTVIRDPKDFAEMSFQVLDNPPAAVPIIETTHVEPEDEKDFYIRILEEEVNTPIPGPLLFRARAILRPQERKTDLVWTVDHSATDGLGCGNFMKTWLFMTLDKQTAPSFSLEMLEKMVPKTKKSKITTFLARKKTVLKHHSEFGSDVNTTEVTQCSSSQTTILASKEEKVAIPPAADVFYPPMIPRHLMAIWGVLCWMAHLRLTLLPLRTLPTRPNRDRKHLDYLENESAKSVKYHTMVVERELTEEETTNLIARCKREGCTVGTALQTALNVAVAEGAVDPAGKFTKGAKAIYSAVNVDMRRLAPLFLPDYKDIDGLATGFYGGFTFLTVNQVKDFVPLLKDTNEFWRTAAKMKGVYAKLFKSGAHLYISSVLGMPTTYKIIDWKCKRYLEANGSLYPSLAFLLSNMGDLGGATPVDPQKPADSPNTFLGAKPSLFSQEELQQIPPISAMHASVTATVPDAQVLVGCFTWKNRLKLFANVSAVTINRDTVQHFLDRAVDIVTNATIN